MPRGGKREGAGRPAPEGRKNTVSMRLTPRVEAYCRQHPRSFGVLSDVLERSADYRRWVAAQQ